jgi:RNA polymerase sigma factor (sigma-70 family)
MTDTRTLLNASVVNRSEDAFRALVTRFLGLVCSTALRQMGGGAHAAEDVAQSVFLDLAKHAGALSPDVMLDGWLHQRTVNVARTMMRSERRRKAREREAFEMSPADEILKRYQIAASGSIPKPDGSGETTDWLIALKSPDSEAIQAVGKDGFRGSSAKDSQELDILAPAMKALFDATPAINGKKAVKLEDLAPYPSTPEQTAAYQRMMARKQVEP